MSTSILDYIFRELAISYLGRKDLAHVEVGDLRSDTIGRGEGDSTRDNGEPELPNLFNKMTSNGFVRGQLSVISNTKTASSGALALANDDAPIETKAYVKTDTQDGMIVQVGISVAQKEKDQVREKIREAKAKGYEGDSCGECGNFTLVRNGTCMKCDTCGSTSGCS